MLPMRNGWLKALKDLHYLKEEEEELLRRAEFSIAKARKSLQFYLQKKKRL